MSKSDVFKKLKNYFDPFYIEHVCLRASLEEAVCFTKGTLLDIGCGKKPYSFLFYDLAEYSIGIDLPNSEDNSADIIASGFFIPLRSDSVDTVLCTEVLEHVPEPQMFIREIARVMRVNGHLILTAPQVWGLHEVPHDYYRYTIFGLKYLAEKGGFKVVKIKKTCGVFGVVGQRLSSYFFYKYKKFFALAIMISAAVSHFYFTLDRISGYEGDTLDNLMIAKKVSP